MSFSLRNKLFKHLRETCWKSRIFDTVFEAFEGICRKPKTFEIDETSISFEKFAAFMINNVEIIIIIHSTAELHDIIIKSGYNFRSWKYVIFKVRYSSNPGVKESDIFSDFGCEIIFGDCKYLLKNVPKLKIRKMILFILI